ncbi:hypothetical protein SAMN05421874_1624 [Nonomuraea maritima]|uniref:Uncharacterized protein n=1 Tax=Nonomuraea maritima TaxID=683260 RepID=A0A1G9SN49_9ACTN|nr:hypothetical protein [Nonomuraea maritima]SDM36757.1 hypothetical protein SAMN05421874_1624 [Nonomuraea maritima]
MNGRFQCSDCGTRSASPYGCRRCGTTTGRQLQRCTTHGARCMPGCRFCRLLTRSQWS